MNQTYEDYLNIIGYTEDRFVKEVVNSHKVKHENKEIEYRAENSKVMAEWTNGRIEARKCDISTLKEIRTYLQSL